MDEGDFSPRRKALRTDTSVVLAAEEAMRSVRAAPFWTGCCPLFGRFLDQDQRMLLDAYVETGPCFVPGLPHGAKKPSRAPSLLGLAPSPPNVGFLMGSEHTRGNPAKRPA